MPHQSSARGLNTSKNYLSRNREGRNISSIEIQNVKGGDSFAQHEYKKVKQGRSKIGREHDQQSSAMVHQ